MEQCESFILLDMNLYGKDFLLTSLKEYFKLDEERSDERHDSRLLK